MANGPKRSLDFVVVGPQRTASSWLHLMLRQHPDVSLPNQVKETMFWDKRFAKGWAWYDLFFDTMSPERRKGEVSPTLFCHELARRRIRRVSRETRIVILLRDPIERALSHYRHEIALGFQRGSLRKAVEGDPRILEGSRYSKYVPKWIADFGQDRVLFIQQEAIAARPAEVLAGLCRFIDVDEGFVFQEMGVRSSIGSTPRLPCLAGLIYRAGSFLREKHWHRPVNLGKRLGITQVLHSKQKGTPSREELRFLESSLLGEREFVNQLPTI